MDDGSVGKRYVVEADDTVDIVLPLIILIVFILFLGWMIYLLVSTGFRAMVGATPIVGSVIASNSADVSGVGTCAAGQCATNLMSGIKTCPDEDVSIRIDPSMEVCNSRYVCDNGLTPFAVQSNGSTRLDGVCEFETECGCLNTMRCPSYILSVYTTSGGNPYQSVSGQRITFPQQSSYVTSNGIATTNPPIEITDPTTTFCTAPLSWLPFSNPGCGFRIANPSSMTYQDLLVCTGQVNHCLGLEGSACLQGILALITNDPDSLNQRNISQARYGCVSVLLVIVIFYRYLIRIMVV